MSDGQAKSNQSQYIRFWYLLHMGSHSLTDLSQIEFTAHQLSKSIPNIMVVE